MALGRLERTRSPAPMSEINMTPLIDVMLVLLVIFMITAPLLATSLRLDLPKADGASPSDAPATLAVALDQDGRLFVAEERADLAALQKTAEAAAQRNPATEVQLRADRGASYGKVVEIIGVLQTAGLSRIGFITAAPAAASAPG